LELINTREQLGSALKLLNQTGRGGVGTEVRGSGDRTAASHQTTGASSAPSALLEAVQGAIPASEWTACANSATISQSAVGVTAGAEESAAAVDSPAEGDRGGGKSEKGMTYIRYY